MDINKVQEWNIEEFLQQSASSAPTPGGGSVSAYAGALGASMVCMVANLTLGKEKYKDVEPIVKEILQKGEKCLSNLKAGMVEDINVFGMFMDVFKMPKETEEQKAKRSVKMQAALMEATESPLNVTRTCFEVLQLAREIAPIGNKGAISDVGVGAYLAESALKSAVLSININLPRIKDEEYKTGVRIERDSILKQVEDILKKTIDIVNSRI